MRIKYTKTDKFECDLKSVNTFQHPTNGAKFRVYINSQNNSYKIVDELVDFVVQSGISISKHKVLINAKAALESCGIKLDKDVRSK